MASVSTAAFAFMLIVAMAAAYPVHKVKVMNQDLTEAIKDGDLWPLQSGKIVYYWYESPAAKKGSAMRDNGEDGNEDKNLVVYSYSGSKKYRNNDYAMRDNGYGKPRNVMG